MERTVYKSIKVTFATWQALTRLTALTGESRMYIIERLVKAEEDRTKKPVG